MLLPAHSVSLVSSSPGLASLPCSALHLHPLQLHPQEIATIYHDQQSPSNPKGRAVNFRDTVASGFRARSSGCVQGTLGLLASTPPVHKHRSPLRTLSPSGCQHGAGGREPCRREPCCVSSKLFSDLHLDFSLYNYLWLKKEQPPLPSFCPLEASGLCLPLMAGLSSGKTHLPFLA